MGLAPLIARWEHNIMNEWSNEGSFADCRPCGIFSYTPCWHPTLGTARSTWSDSSCRIAEQQNEFSGMRILNVLSLRVSALHNEWMWIVWMLMALLYRPASTLGWNWARTWVCLFRTRGDDGIIHGHIQTGDTTLSQDTVFIRLLAVWASVYVLGWKSG